MDGPLNNLYSRTMTTMPAIYLFIFIGPELFIELISAGPVGKFDNRSIDELFPMLIEDQNITTVFDFEVKVKTFLLLGKNMK